MVYFTLIRIRPNKRQDRKQNILLKDVLVASEVSTEEYTRKFIGSVKNIVTKRDIRKIDFGEPIMMNGTHGPRVELTLELPLLIVILEILHTKYKAP